MLDISKIVKFIRSKFPNTEFIPLHSPIFLGNEKQYLNETIDSTFVSSVGEFVNRFENELSRFLKADYAVATSNGTSALHTALLVCDVEKDDEVLTQAITFVATANAINYIAAKPVFIDVDIDTFSMSPSALSSFLEKNAAKKQNGYTYNRNTGRKISACVPMHTFGLASRIEEIKEVCDHWNISLIEDAAESLGTYYEGKHTGTFGKVGVFSFNGNKIITCGGGGAVVTSDPEIAQKAKHLTTQAKLPHAWRFYHDELGYNYRMPNLNAALAFAQLEQLPDFLTKKRKLAHSYQAFFEGMGVSIAKEMIDTKSNYWLNALILDNRSALEEFLLETNRQKVMTRPIWDLMSTLPMYQNCENDGLKNSRWLVDRVVNIPSSVTNFSDE
jgi:aminotransferase in exopolysaccharide biosynthesis